MKKLNLLLLTMIAFLGLATITSCNPDTTDVAKPTIDFTAEGGSIVADKVDMDTAAPIQFIINLDESVDTKKNLKTFKITSIKNNTTNVDTIIEDINSANAKYTFNFYTPNENSTDEVFTFILTDKAGVSVSKKITITTKDTTVIVPSPDPINTFSNITLGAQSNPTEGSFLNLHTGAALLTSAANASPGDIDLIYFYGGSTDLAVLAAPSDDIVNGGAGNSNLALSLTTQRDTYMAISTKTGAEFDAMVDNADFPTAIAGSATAQNMLTVGTVIEFLTNDGKFGYLKIVSLTAGAAETMLIDIKIEQ